VPINRAVRTGDADALQLAFRDAGESARWLPVDSAERLRHELGRWADQLAALAIRPVLPTREVDEPARSRRAAQALRALAQRQLLCALREDSYGALAINGWIEQQLKRVWGLPEDRVWYPGRAVLITRNDHAARLYNGDVGLCLADASGELRVWFETVDADGASAARSFAPATLPAHEGAFAITVHKSQGSEYDHAAVLLPPDPQHRILSRQLLYTGLSRARRAVELWGATGAVQAALAQPVQRAGGLAARLMTSEGEAPGQA
jgi:exodeoxyribonuclease V alpha subunit